VIINSDPEHTKRGFTLIELSIVLVVIGLIIGGIIIGQTLIQSAQIRRQTTEFGKWYAAVNTYRIKYNALPGDDANAVALGIATTRSVLPISGLI
jgi:prepilin-type N-terminal cleavage/methylation domain-containing protein